MIDADIQSPGIHNLFGLAGDEVTASLNESAEATADDVIPWQASARGPAPSGSMLIFTRIVAPARFRDLADEGASLDLLYIPTWYLNGLPGGLPSRAFREDDSERAIERERTILAAVEDAFGRA